MKKFFLPIDDSLHSTHALQYMKMMAPIFKDAVYSLFYVQPIVSDFLIEEAKTNPQAIKKLDQLNNKNEMLGNEILNRRKEELLHFNVPEERVNLLTEKRKQGAAKDIIWQAEKEAADAIIIGRHGFSKIQETFIGSTSKNLIEHCDKLPVCIIDGDITSADILLAIDGSTDSLKALDYMLEIIRDFPDTKLTLFHVQPSLRDCCGIDFTEENGLEEQSGESLANIVEKANRQCIDNFMGYAAPKLKEKGIKDQKLTMKIQATKVNIGHTIVEEFKNGKYGSLFVGKRGGTQKFFMGSVSHYLVTHMENAALWVIP